MKLHLSTLAVLCGMALTVQSFGQGVLTGNTITVKSGPTTYLSRNINTRTFLPQVSPGSTRIKREKKHVFKFNYLDGLSNDLPSGGDLANPRAGLLDSVFFPAIDTTGWEPPDPDIAVSRTHIVEVVNSDIAFYEKNGRRTFQQSFGQFFASTNPSAFLFDPKAFFDAESGRFFVVCLALNDAAQTSEFMIAVSANGNPNGSWRLLKIDNTTTVGSDKLWLDYPGWGFSRNAIVATGNMFPFVSGPVVTQVFGFQKSQLISGAVNPAKVIINDAFTVQTAKGDTTQTACFSVHTNSRTSVDVAQFLVSGDTSSTTMTINRATVAVPAWTPDSGGLAGPDGRIVQTNDPRMLSSSYRTVRGSGRLVSSHSVATSPSDTRAAARWYEFNVTGMSATVPPQLVQSGTVPAPAGHGHSFPAIAVNAFGDIGMSFSRIGVTTAGDVYATGRKQTDPPGTMGAPIVLERSVGSKYSGGTTRWGDYLDVEVDPLDNRTFWAVGMGVNARETWTTWIKSFAISVPDEDLTGFNALNATVFNGSIVRGSLPNLNEADGANYLIRSANIRGLGQTSGMQANFRAAFPNGKPAEVRVAVKCGAPNGATGTFFLRNRATNLWEAVTSFAFMGSDVVRTFTLTEAQLARYVSDAGDVSVVLRAHLPSRPTGSAGSFLFLVDQIKVLALPQPSEE